MVRPRAFAAAVLACLLAAGTASAQTSIQCSGPNFRIFVKPILKVKPLQELNPGADCALWQTFFYLNWPAQTGKTGGRGIPDKNARFGAPGPTVWETYRRVEQVFLSDGRKPPGWNESFPQPELSPEAATEVDAGQARLLIRKSKISRRTIDVIGQAFGDDPFFLQYIKQADGYILYDQEKQPVYYEIAMNHTQFKYIVDNRLYNAECQLTYSAKTNIVLPVGAVELKAAWKILTPAEAASGRFHTAKAYLSGSPPQQVTVGLVALHVFTSGGANTIGMWGTFAHVDNVPVHDEAPKGRYTFYNPICSATECLINNPTTVPTQAVQMLPDDLDATTINTNVQSMIATYEKRFNIKSAWRYYKLLNVQWSSHGFSLGNPPVQLPLPHGIPTIANLVNPVEETFQQAPGVSCVKCHGNYAGVPNTNIGSGFSFMFSHAESRSDLVCKN